MKFSVYKFDPMTDSEPHYVTADVPFEENMTALRALMYIDENVEHINYDHSCRSRVCGRCAMTLNGDPSLICVERVDENMDYILEPLAGFPVVRDLVVDKHAFDDKITGISERIRIEPFTTETIVADPEYFVNDMWDTYAIDYCCRCGCCTSSCPAHQVSPQDYIGPAAMLAVMYRHLDPLDQGDRVLEAVSKGLYRCIQCGKCDEVCSQHEIDHLGSWAALRALAEERGIKPSYAS